nr:VWA domain-containing protein [Schlegelella koreensis]
MRRAALPVGPDRVIAALDALEQVGVERRGDVHAALAAVMLDSHEQQPIFDALFDAFWRDPKLLERVLAELLPEVTARAGSRDRTPRSNRLAEALSGPRPATAERPREETSSLDASITFSDRERLQRADFETMTATEFAAARRLVEEVPMPVAEVQRRRHEAAPRGRIDLRATLQRMARDPSTLEPATTRPRRETPALVLLIDISGSMERYARVLLHWAHGLTRRHHQVHTLTFGTRLTNVTRALRGRDPDLALQRADAQVPDWKGGTRIASCLDDFNRHWARRLLGSSAALILVTDGLDRDEHGDLASAAAQLRRFAAEIVWLNPLLRYDGFEPRAAGVRALLPHVDRFLPVHNLASLEDLGRALRGPNLPGRRGASRGRMSPRPRAA